MAAIWEKRWGLDVGFHIEFHFWKEVLGEKVEVRNWCCECIIFQLIVRAYHRGSRQARSMTVRWCVWTPMERLGVEIFCYASIDTRIIMRSVKSI